MLRALLLSLILAAPAGAEPLLLAAASTGSAIDAALSASGQGAVTSYGASGLLARQIEQGAPADVFLSANPRWMAHLVEAGLVRAEDVVPLMSNRLVLIGPEGGAAFSPDRLAARLAGEVFAMADPQTAPVGAYGQAALQALGLWDDVAAAFVPMRNTLGTVAAVASGDATLGLVYASDAMGQAGVTILWTIPEDSHPEIRYLIAPVGQGEDAEGGAALIAWLTGPEGADALARFGFVTGGAAP